MKQSIIVINRFSTPSPYRRVHHAIYILHLSDLFMVAKSVLKTRRKHQMRDNKSPISRQVATDGFSAPSPLPKSRSLATLNRPRPILPSAELPRTPRSDAYWQRTEYYMEEQALWKIWQDFGAAGIPATDSAGSIRVYAHSTETRSSAPTTVMLRQRGQREGNICSVAWGTSVLSLLLTV